MAVSPQPTSDARLGGLPVRLPLSRCAVEWLADTAGIRLPWQQADEPVDTLASRLSPAAPTAAPTESDDPVTELSGLGVLTDGGVRPSVLAALATFAQAPISVDLDLSRRAQGAPQGFAQLRAWHRRSGDRVAWLTTNGGRFELAWCDLAWWHHQLTAVVSDETDVDEAEATGDSAGTPPAPDLAVSLPLLLASGECFRRGREDLLADLQRHHVDGARAPQPLSSVDAQVQLRRVHGSVTARLRATVAGYGLGGDRRLGVVSWLRYADGWRALTPLSRPEGPWVRLAPVPRQQLAAEVARLVHEVRGC